VTDKTHQTSQKDEVKIEDMFSLGRGCWNLQGNLEPILPVGWKQELNVSRRSKAEPKSAAIAINPKPKDDWPLREANTVGRPMSLPGDAVTQLLGSQGIRLRCRVCFIISE
jgi:hypothetical protein